MKDTIDFNPTPLLLAMRLKGWGIAKVATLADSSVGTVHRVITGKSPNSKAILPIARALGVRIENCLKAPTPHDVTFARPRGNSRRVARRGNPATTSEKVRAI